MNKIPMTPEGYLKLQVELKKLTSEEEKLLIQLKKSKNFKPNPGKTEKGFFDRVRDFMS